MHTRESALNGWLQTILPNQSFALAPLAGDASFRRYFRLHCGEHVRVVMDAPPVKESILPFLDVGKRLREAGVRVPYVYASDPILGFALLEDFGDTLFLQALQSENPNTLYTGAMNTLLTIQHASTNTPPLPHFDQSFMQQELTVFREWFLENYLSLQTTKDQEQLLDDTFHTLIEEIALLPQVFIHRDYHSRNILLLAPKNQIALGVIDFQDAMLGPLPYDLVSLLKDCYIQWPREQVRIWIEYFYNQLQTSPFASLSDFVQGFDQCGLQRHLKVLGVFSRLHLRDNKSAYLRDLPLTFHYVLDCLESYDTLKPFYQFMQNEVYPAFLKRQNA